MSKQVTVAGANRYCQARLAAAQYNPTLLTRPGAASVLPGVTEDSLKKYELDITKPPNDIVALMADAYNCPELRSWYCANECPLGRNTREIDDMSSERALIRLKNSVEDVVSAVDAYSRIMDDGMITADEKAQLPVIKDNFLKARQRIDENLAALEKADKLGRFD